MRVIDLSYKLVQGIPVYPGDAALLLEPQKTHAQDGYTAFVLRSGMHAGTHLDMPMHMTGDGRFACDFPLSQFIGEGLLIDARGQKKIGLAPDYEKLALRDKIVIFWTGASLLTDGVFQNAPEITPELARFLLEGGIKMLGTDAPAPDRPPFPVHKLLLERGVCILENLTNLEELAKIKGFTVCALPLSIAAEASLTRAVALVP